MLLSSASSIAIPLAIVSKKHRRGYGRQSPLVPFLEHFSSACPVSLRRSVYSGSLRGRLHRCAMETCSARIDPHTVFALAPVAISLKNALAACAAARRSCRSHAWRRESAPETDRCRNCSAHVAAPRQSVPAPCPYRRTAWERRERAVGAAVVLHKNEIPYLDIAVAIGVWRTGRPARNMRAVIVKNFRARPARPGFGHLPEVVGTVARAFMVADPHNARGGHADLLLPDGVRLIVFVIDRYPQFFWRQPVHVR